MKKFSNKILIIVLVILVGVFALSRLFRSPKLESNLKKELVKLDTARVTEVRIKTAVEGAQELRLIKTGKKWKVTTESKEADAGEGTVQSMLGVVMNLRAQRMVSRKRDRWENYQVGENSTRVSIYNGSDKLADFRVGKTGFTQGQSGGGGSAFTYLRLTDEDEVYTSDGFLVTHFNRTFGDWRNQIFLKVNRDQVSKIEFTYPDSSFVLEKRDSIWLADGSKAIETKVTQYFSKIRVNSISTFEEAFVPGGKAPFRIQVFGAAGPLLTAQAWPKNEDEWVLTSTIQEGVYFTARKSETPKDVFVGKRWFTVN